MTTLVPTKQEPNIIWEKLPSDYILPDEPVESILQPLLAQALTESLDLAGLITPIMLIATNMGICTKIDNKTVIKAPDWFFVPRVSPLAEGEIRRSYTPYIEGELPTVVMEFLSDNDSSEYSVRPTYPYGKMWFYERILKVPYYIIYDPSVSHLEILQLQQGGYRLQTPDAQGRYFIPSLGLYLGILYGTRQENRVYWLRWWDESGNLLLWGSERIAQEKERVEQERQRAQQERQRAEQAEQEVERLREILKQAGIPPED